MLILRVNASFCFNSLCMPCLVTNLTFLIPAKMKTLSVLAFWPSIFYSLVESHPRNWFTFVFHTCGGVNGMAAAVCSRNFP